MIQPQHTPTDVFRRALDLLETLTAISSPSGDLDGLERSARCLGAALERQGLAVEIRHEPDATGLEQPMLYARGSDTEDGHLLLIGHLDTVLPAAPKEHRDGRLYATGAVDMKGGLVALVGALDLLASQGRQGARDLLLVVVPDEEVAGSLSFEALEKWGPGARGLWVLEPGQRQGEAETIVLGRRGTFHWHLEARGRGAHAGNDFWQGRSALDAAARWCVEARRMARPGRGPTVNTGRMVAGDRDFVGDLAAGAERVGTDYQINVVPDRARVDGEARFLKRSEGEELIVGMENLSRDLAAELEVEIDFTHGVVIPPLEPHAGGRRWAAQAVEMAREMGWPLEVEEERGGISFPNFLPDPSALPILDGLGPAGGGMHTREEYVDLASLDRRIALLAELLVTL